MTLSPRGNSKPRAHPEVARIWEGRRSRRLPGDIQAAALRKLRLLNQARVLGDLRLPPGNRLEPLRGSWAGQHSIRINDQWRIVSSGPTEGRGMSKSSTIMTDASAAEERLPNPHPGEILLEEFLKPMGLSQNALARYFGLSDGVFLGLQTDFNLMQRRREIEGELSAIAPRAA